jgi:hypothetical protein
MPPAAPAWLAGTLLSRGMARPIKLAMNHRAEHASTQNNAYVEPDEHHNAAR